MGMLIFPVLVAVVVYMPLRLQPPPPRRVPMPRATRKVVKE